MQQLNPIDNDVEEIIQWEKDSYTVTMTNGSVFNLENKKCDCGHENEYTPSRSASFEQSYRDRRSASCKHYIAILNAKRIGPCSDCGSYQIDTKKLHHHGRHVMNSFSCANCGSDMGLD